VSDLRLQHEIAHGKFLIRQGAGEIWNWESPAGIIRWQRRVQMLTSHLEKNMQVLEIGCGTGYFTKELAKKEAKITAIDISPELIAEAQKSIRAENVHFAIDNAYQLLFQDNIFDSVVGSSVLHHLEINRALGELYRVLKIDGTIYFTEPNMLNPQIALQKNIPYLKRKFGDSPDETAFFKSTLRKMLEEAGFVHICIEPFDFLHPAIPGSILSFFEPLCELAEHIPLLKEIAGSLYIRARKGRN